MSAKWVEVSTLQRDDALETIYLIDKDIDSRLGDFKIMMELTNLSQEYTKKIMNTCEIDRIPAKNSIDISLNFYEDTYKITDCTLYDEQGVFITLYSLEDFVEAKPITDSLKWIGIQTLIIKKISEITGKPKSYYYNIKNK